MALDSGPHPELLLNTKNNSARNKKTAAAPAPALYMHYLVCEMKQPGLPPSSQSLEGRGRVESDQERFRFWKDLNLTPITLSHPTPQPRVENQK